jgi:P4 family phage/plasmid primase-like protien
MAAPTSGAGAYGGSSGADVAAALRLRIDELAIDLLGAPNRHQSNAHELRFGSRGSLSVAIAGESAGSWFDHEAGEGGAGLELIERCLVMARPAALQWAREWLGQTPDRRPANARPLADHPAKAGPEQRDCENARRKIDLILEASVSPVGSPVIAYLQRRGITGALPDCIRYRPGAWGPYGAMVVLATDDTGEVLAVQQTYLTEDGRKAEIDVQKRINASVPRWARRAAVRLPGRLPLVICEGVETALSVWRATGQQTWALLSVSNLASAPVDEHDTVIIARDGDALGTMADQQVHRAVSSIQERGVKVLVATPPQDQDFNDVLQKAGEAAVRKYIAEAIMMQSSAMKRPKTLDLGSDVEIARRIREDLITASGDVVFAEGKFWQFAESYWEPISEHRLRRRIHDYDGANYPTASGGFRRVQISKSKGDSILHELSVLCADPDFFEVPATGINAANGLVSIGTDGTPQLIQHHPDHRLRHVLPGHWRPDLSGIPPEDSLLGRYLRDCFKGDPDAEEKIALLAEICGCAALGYATRLRQPRAFLLYGPGAANGKSAFLDIVRGLLPDRATVSISPEKLSDERYLADLAGKLLNASDEISAAVIGSETFKATVTGERISARSLYRNRIEFRPAALHIFTSNQLPRFESGVDRGVRRRLMIIPFLRTIPVDQRVENIGQQIVEKEADQLLAWAMAGASRLVRNCDFSEPDACSHAQREWLVDADPVLAWIEACVTVQTGPGAPRMKTRDLFLCFRKWAASEGFSEEELPVQNAFTRRLQTELPGVRYDRTKNSRFLVGVSVTAP